MVVAGKYEELCNSVRIDAKADAVVLVVIYGKYGSGFCVQANSGLAELLPTILRKVAQDIASRT
jgi:hypothetical protein